VFDQLHRVGIAVRHSKIERIDLEEAVRLYKSGLSLARVGEAIGVSAGTVRDAFGPRASTPDRPDPMGGDRSRDQQGRSS
jgi:hypothetical protein